MKKVGIFYSGCVQCNTYVKNFEVQLKANGFSTGPHFIDQDDYIVFAGCAGCESTIDKEIKYIGELASYCNEKNKKFILVGCVTKLKKIFANIKEYDNVLIVEDNNWIVPVMNYLKKESKKTDVNADLLNSTWFHGDSFASPQIFIQRGCTNKCSFCKSNYIDMSVKSLPYKELVHYLKLLIAYGAKELILSGENPTVYGIDLYHKPMLHQLLHELRDEDKLERIELGEIAPQNMYPALLEEIITNPKVSAVSMQMESASNKILKLMNRNYTLENYDYIAKKIIDAGKYIDTILMSGFPYETYEDLDITIDYVTKRKIYVADICEYIDFKGVVPSSEYEQLSVEEKIAHTRYLQSAIDENNHKVLQDYANKVNKYIYLGLTESLKYKFAFDLGTFILDDCSKYTNLNVGDVIETRAEYMLTKTKKGIKAEFKL